MSAAFSKPVWICTDMEGLAGVDHWDQCYDPDDASPKYLHGREQLTADTNAAIAGCFDAGATEVLVLDGHGRNRGKGFIPEKFDRRARTVRFTSLAPVRWERLDEAVGAVVIVGQHAMAGTIGGFLDHTEIPKELCRFRMNGTDRGELAMMAMYAGHYGVPVVHASGDEALCEEAKRLLPGIVTTPTKRGTGWGTCELYPSEKVRENLRRDVAAAVRGAGSMRPWRVTPPVEIAVEWAWSGRADPLARVPGVERVDARTVRWRIDDARDVFSWPGKEWQPVRASGTR